MGEIFSENEYNDILEKCRKFKKLFLDTSEKEVYVQLVHEMDGYDGIRVTFDVYPKRFLGRLMDYVLSPNRSPIPLFSYCFETKVKEGSYEYKEIKSAAQRNNGWLEAELCDEKEQNCDFYGQLVWQCGDVEYSNVGIKMQYGISDSAMQIINRTIVGFDGKSSDSIFHGDYIIANETDDTATSYDINLYTVGDANTSLITNNNTRESLLVDCGIERNVNYRYLYSQAESEIKMLNPEYVFISHNHEDHYNLFFVNGAVQSLVLGLNNNTSLKKVVLRDTSGACLSQTIIRGLLGTKLLLLNTSVFNYKYAISNDFPNVFIEFGNCPDPSRCVANAPSYYENDTGMILYVHNRKKVVFTGDCSFDFIPTSVNLSDADYIILPHHGGKVVMSNTISLKSQCVPIVSSGFTKFYLGSGYQSQYDQGSFLQNCGVTSKIIFLRANPNPYFKVKGV